MASPSNTNSPISGTPTTYMFPNVTTFVYVKLDGPNYHMWLSQFLPVLRVHELMEGSEPCPHKFLLDDQGKDMTTGNPDFSIWTKKDQCILSWINAILTKKVLSMVYGLNTSRQGVKSGLTLPPNLPRNLNLELLIWSVNFNIFVRTSGLYSLGHRE
jgi:hypothetical protein